VIDKRSQIRRVYALIIDKVMGGFFGEIYIKMEHGNIVFVREIQNRKPTADDVVRLVSDYLANKDVGGNLEISLRKIDGKPHLSLVRKGCIDDVIPIEVVDRAEKYKPTISVAAKRG